MLWKLAEQYEEAGEDQIPVKDIKCLLRHFEMHN